MDGLCVENPSKMDDDWGYPHLWKPQASIQHPSSTPLACRAAVIQLRFDLGIKTQSANKHQRSIQVIPEARDPLGDSVSDGYQPEDCWP